MSDWTADDGDDQWVNDHDEEHRSAEEQRPQPVYPTVHEWVKEYLRYAYRRRIDGKHRLWWHKWWEVDEALIRLEALWRAWEHLRLDPGTGMSTWWRDHADHHMPLLLGADGPFAGIEGIDSSESTCRKLDPLPHTDAPAWMFTDQDESNG